jgi:dihydroorotate dehydrogenase (fumarate)
MIDLSTSYLGLNLKNPVVPSPSPQMQEIDNLRRMQDSGAAAVVLHSLFEEQITLESDELDNTLYQASDVSAEAISLFPDMTQYNIGPEEYLDHVHKAKQAVQIPVIASLNGVSNGGWIRYAKLIEDAGADALELNIYFMPTNQQMTCTQIESMYTELIAHIASTVRIPLAVKLHPFFTSMGNVARNIEMAGANGLVLFNRFYQPDFDLENLEVVPSLQLSRSNELRLRLHWTAMLFGNINADIAITGGVHTPEDVIKCMMAGARVAMTTSALLQNGIEYLKPLIAGVEEWCEQHEYESIRQMQGSMSYFKVPHRAAYERANYMKVLSSYVA